MTPKQNTMFPLRRCFIYFEIS